MAALNVNLAHITMPTTEKDITNGSKNEEENTKVNVRTSRNLIINTNPITID